MPDENSVKTHSTDEAAEATGMAAQNLARLARAGKIHGCLKLDGKNWRWHLPTLLAWMKDEMERQRVELAERRVQRMHVDVEPARPSRTVAAPRYTAMRKHTLVQGAVWGRLDEVWPGGARQGRAGRDMAARLGQSGSGSARHGMARRGMAGLASWRGGARRGRSWQAWRGWLGRVWRGTAWQAWQENHSTQENFLRRTP